VGRDSLWREDHDNKGCEGGGEVRTRIQEVEAGLIQHAARDDDLL
jgi:hypothetical protein